MSIGEFGTMIDSVANVGGFVVGLIALLYTIRPPRP